nr:hypothetical protein [Tanacetum cinerariifolium]
MYPRFIHLIIQNQLGDLSTHTIKDISLALTQKVFANMRRVGKGCSGVETQLFEGMLVAREPEEQGDVEEQGTADNATKEPVTAASEDDEALDACATLARRVKHLEHDKVAQDLEIIKLKTRVKKLERTNKVKTLKLRRLRKVGTTQRVDTSDDTLMEDVSNHGRIIDELDKDEGVVLMNEKEETEEVRDNTSDAQVEGRQADIYQIDMDHAAKVLSMQKDESEVHEAVEVVTTTKLITEVVAAVSETVSAVAIVPAAVSEIVSAAVVVPTVTVAPVKVDTEAQARRNMMMYLKNTAGFRLDYFKGMSYDDIRLIFKAKFNSNIEFLLKTKEEIEEEANRAIESINETPAQKVAKKRRKNEEVKDVEELKWNLKIMPDEDDDLYTEATPHARKNFDREDLESLGNIVKERFSTSKPNNFLDDFLLTTLRAMFGRPDGQDQVWMSQRSVHGQARVKSWKLLESCGVYIVALTTTQLIMLAERRYPLARFTLDHMLNAVRLRVEEQSEIATKKNNAAKSRKDYDDVFTEATPLARKVPVVDYQIVHINNKPHFKIIRADETHQLYVSFITLLKNFDREDLESLWNIVKERFFTSKPNNFSDDFLLTTLKAIFGRPDGQDQVWMSQITDYPCRKKISTIEVHIGSNAKYRKGHCVLVPAVWFPRFGSGVLVPAFWRDSAQLKTTLRFVSKVVCVLLQDSLRFATRLVTFCFKARCVLSQDSLRFASRLVAFCLKTLAFCLKILAFCLKIELRLVYF